MIARSGGLGVMRQFIGMIGDDRTLYDLALQLAPPACGRPGRGCTPPSCAMHAEGTEKAQLRYATPWRLG